MKLTSAVTITDDLGTVNKPISSIKICGEKGENGAPASLLTTDVP